MGHAGVIRGSELRGILGEASCGLHRKQFAPVSPALLQTGTPLVVQDDAEKATVDGEPAVVVDEAKPFKLVHEMTDA